MAIEIITSYLLHQLIPVLVRCLIVVLDSNVNRVLSLFILQHFSEFIENGGHIHKYKQKKSNNYEY